MPTRGAEPEMDGPVGVLVEDERWRVIDIDLLANRACTAAIRHLGGNPRRFDIGLLACDDDRIEELNSRFRSQAKPTNVLSWPSGTCLDGPETVPDSMGREPDALGDIAISWDTCRREAEEFGRPLADHVVHLVVHSCLHLLGYRHKSEADARKMEELETEVLASLGVSDPYCNRQQEAAYE